MPTPKFWKSKTILAKIESVYGSDPTPTGAANAILAQNVSFTPLEGEVIQRQIERTHFGALPFVVQGIRSRLTFSVDLAGSGTAGTAPAWGPVLRACAVAQTIVASTSVEYTPITDNVESVAIYFDIDGTKHIMLGCEGTATKSISVNGNPIITFDVIGLFTDPSEGAKPTPDYSGWQAPQAVSTANTPVFTIGGVSFVMRSFELNLGVQVEPRILVGSESIRITGKDNERVTCVVEAVPVSTYNPSTIVRTGALQEIEIEHGTVAGNIVNIVIPAAQQLPHQYQESQGILEWTLPFVPQPTAGNDQWSILLT